jgi:hypothetical protein
VARQQTQFDVRRLQGAAGARGRIVAISPDDGSAIDLKNPLFAAALAWLVPGLGHLYQGRRFKGWLFAALILGIFSSGFWMGGGRVVYWWWKPGEQRWAMICQAGIGLAAVPAFVQSLRLDGASKAPLAGGFMAPPVGVDQLVDEGYARQIIRRNAGITEEDFRRQPRMRLWEFQRDELSIWQRQLGRWFEIGTLYTMIAGMLNMLVIYDAWAGPLGGVRDEDRRRGTSDQPAPPPGDS